MDKPNSYYLAQMQAFARQEGLEAEVTTTLNEIVEGKERRLGRPLTTDEFRVACCEALYEWDI